MIRNKKEEINVITPMVQTANLKGVLNNNINNGQLNPDNPNNTLENLYDVNVSELNKNDILIYNGLSWVNKSYTDVAKQFIWNLDGGSAQDYEDDDEENENPENPPDTSNNLAEQAIVVLNDFIDSDEFQDTIKGNKNIIACEINGSNIDLTINGRINNLLNLFYNNNEIVPFIGHIVTSVYENISRDIRATLDNLSNDINDSIVDWKVSGIEENNYNAKVFVYFSDFSGLFLNVDIHYKQK